MSEIDHVKTFTDRWKAFSVQNKRRLKTEFTVISLLRWDSKLAYSVNESTNKKWENCQNQFLENCESLLKAWSSPEEFIQNKQLELIKCSKLCGVFNLLSPILPSPAL